MGRTRPRRLGWHDHLLIWAGVLLYAVLILIKREDLMDSLGAFWMRRYGRRE